MMLLFVAASAQTVTLTFTGHDINDRYVQLDSVSVTNQTKGWSVPMIIIPAKWLTIRVSITPRVFPPFL